MTDSTIAPPQNQRFSSTNERFVAARHEEGCYEENIFIHCFVCKGLSNDDVGVARGTLFEEIRPDAGFKTDDFVKENWGGIP